MNETKEYIIKTSLILFLQKSYKDVTMSEIVKKTGLSKGAFYHYFDSKEALFKEIAFMFISMGVVNYESFNRNSLLEFYQQYASYLSTSIKEMNKMVGGDEENNSNINFFHILFEAVGRFPEFLQMELDMHKKDLHAWSKVIENARNNGEIASPSSNEDIANLFLFCNDGVFLRSINNDTPTAFADFLLKTYETIYNNIKA